MGGSLFVMTNGKIWTDQETQFEATQLWLMKRRSVCVVTLFAFLLIMKDKINARFSRYRNTMVYKQTTLYTDYQLL